MESLNAQERENYIKVMDLFLEMQKMIHRIRDLHRPIQCDCTDDCTVNVCSQCFIQVKLPQDYPCPTIKALDGEQ